MKNRWIQNGIILLLFAVAITVVVILGVRQEKNQIPDTGIKLSEKSDWSDALKSTDTAEDAERTVYKTEKGTKYHLYYDCSSLKKSKTIIGLRKADAENEGKTLCSICEKRYEKE